MKYAGGYIETSLMPVHYVENNPGKNKVIFFIHGNSGSAQEWAKQFADTLFDDYHLIAFDIPGCGQSKIEGKSDWDFSLLSMGKVIADAILILRKDRPYYLIGLSLGTNIMGEALEHHLNPAGITLLSPSILGDGFGVDKIFLPGDSIFFHDNVEEGQVNKFYRETLLNATDVEIRQYTADFCQTHELFRSALISTVMQGRYSDEINSIKKLNIPVQIIFGAGDKIVNTDYLDKAPLNFWNNIIYKISGAGHYVHRDDPVQTNFHFSEYLNSRAS